MSVAAIVAGVAASLWGVRERAAAVPLGLGALALAGLATWDQVSTGAPREVVSASGVGVLALASALAFRTR
jgi:hypothetical protein